MTTELPNLSDLETVTREQISAIATALGLDPHAVGSITVTSERIIVIGWDAEARRSSSRVLPRSG